MRSLAVVVAVGCAFKPGMPVGPGPGSADAGSDGLAWWNTAWTERVPITITTTVALSAGYQIGVQYPVGNPPCASHGAGHPDVRVVDGATEIERVIDDIPVQQTAWTWFQLSAPLAAGATSSGEYWIYCDNPAAPAVPDEGAEVFDFYDAFDAADPSTWNAHNGARVIGGYLVCDPTTMGDVGIVSNNEVTADQHAVDFAAILQSGTSNWWGGFQTGVGDVRPWSIWYQDPTNTSGSVTPSYVDTNGASQIFEGTGLVQDTNEHIYTVADFATKDVFWFDETPYQSHTYAPEQPPPTSFDLRLWIRSAGADQAVSFDWIRLRQVVDPLPVASAGQPEMYR